MMMRPTIDRIKELLSYNPKTGVVVWRVNRQPNIKAGSEAGNLRPDGKRRIKVDGVLIYTHQIAWAIHYGRWPDEGLTIDHKDRIGDNNRIRNLREATYTEQSQNRVFKRNSVGRGLRVQCGRFVAQIQHNGRKIHIGTFDNAKEAKAARDAKEKELFGSFSTV